MSYKKQPKPISGLNPTRREFLDKLIDGWRVRAYIEILPHNKDDFVFTIEHNSDDNSIVRFDQSNHDHFHVDIIGKAQKPFQEFPEAKSNIEKIDAALKFIRETLNYTVKHGVNELKLSEQRLKEFREKIAKELGKLELGKRTTSVSITSNAYIIKPNETENKI